MIYTGSDEYDDVGRADAAGAVGYLHKHALTSPDLADALHVLHTELPQPRSRSRLADVARRKETSRSWSFLTSHGVALVEVTRAPDATVRELAERSNLTERQMHRVLDDLVAAGYVSRSRVGRRNHYSTDLARPMRHPSIHHHLVAKLIAALAPVHRSDDHVARATRIRASLTSAPRTAGSATSGAVVVSVISVLPRPTRTRSTNTCAIPEAALTSIVVR